jgi:hypothetical protein
VYSPLDIHIPILGFQIDIDQLQHYDSFHHSFLAYRLLRGQSYIDAILHFPKNISREYVFNS